ncbi:MAG: DUF2784 domain-containing protein [Gammaproteobacteria bacterium]|nr:DUF2784 domain-containing protein [Gammaproteobacteria bacterium]
MTAETWYQLLADGILVVHFSVVLFVGLGLIAGILFLSIGWPAWAGNHLFILVHIVVVAIVVIQSWIGVLCPLTTIEGDLRRLAGQSPYDQSFVQYWLQRLLYYQAEPWVFTAFYTAFAVIALLVWTAILRRRSQALGR